MVRVIIDGNIGSGKTTQLALLEKTGYTVRREAIQDWPLEEFYNDPARWAFLLHTSILLTNQPGEGDPPLVLFERSLMSSRWVFWEVMKKQGLVTAKEDAIYDKLYDKHAWRPDLFIYLTKSPERCFEHIQGRNQPGDQGSITLDYLQQLDAAYKKLLANVPCKVLFVNADRPAEKIHAEIYRHLVEHTDEAYSLVAAEPHASSVDGERSANALFSFSQPKKRTNELFVSDPQRNEMQTKGGRRRKMPCSSLPDMCRLS
jgi:deoxyadenosine/deoxycytidine kinase